ncbi:MAG: UDP-N-acetylglucosamine 1-carboxyvinyltransferase [Oscillospiraceae bacterium]|jgi:UDP-N-acetylglucosamine 1-carboxyvinyltransferase|nr:UDP-N-acetylglucosamine 1-carboxyvinyltransferase [Oscillospiraceae bacterium]
MKAYQIYGGSPLCGTVAIHGAKNSVLPILAATLITGGEYVLRNCPQISDVDTALDILRHLGCSAERSGQTLTIDTTNAKRADIPCSLMTKMRAAVIFLGPLLARFGCAQACMPGGCALGARPIDIHLAGLRRMDVHIDEAEGDIFCMVSKLKACTIALPFPSVGATENLLLAAIACDGEVAICNAAREPEIGDLIGFLRACGAEISGDGTSVIRVQGGKALHTAQYSIMPDRMEAASYLAAAAATKGDLTLQGVCPAHLTAVSDVLVRSGCEIDCQNCEMRLRCEHLLAAGPIHTAPYDGFPTDAQAPIMAAMTVAAGVSVFEETIFEDRFRHVPALQDLGAKIHASKRYAVVEGVPALHGACMEATDLRGGAAMVIGALCARGESRVRNVAHIERGYADFVETLRQCGAEIAQIDEA